MQFVKGRQEARAYLPKMPQGTRSEVSDAVPAPASCVFMTRVETRCTAKNSTHFDTWFLFIPDWVHGSTHWHPFCYPSSGLFLSQTFPTPASYHLHRVASILYNYQLELAPVNNIPLHLVQTTTNWPPSCSQRLSLHTTSPWEQLQLRNLFVVSQHQPLSSAGLGQLQQLSIRPTCILTYT